MSRRAVVEQEYSAEREALLEDLQEGNTVKGIVKNLTDYGAFVDLGGIDGLLHITDMAWKRVKHPSEVIEVGVEIEVKILKFDRERQRVSLGIKQLGDDPWKDLARRYPPQTRIFGKVTNIADYGCFVEIEDGVEGLVHVSEMDWTNKNVIHLASFRLAKKSKSWLLRSTKNVVEFPWASSNVSPIRGLSLRRLTIAMTKSPARSSRLPISEFSLAWKAASTGWSTFPTSLGKRAKRRSTTIRRVRKSKQPFLRLTQSRERISLGIKQLEKDPFSSWLAEHPKNSIVKGTVSEVDARGATIDLGDGILGSLRASEMARGRVEDARTLIKVGEEVEAKFTNVDRKNRTIALSIKAKEVHEEAEAMSSYQSEEGATPAGTTLGELLKEKMGGGSK